SGASVVGPTSTATSVPESFSSLVPSPKSRPVRLPQAFRSANIAPDAAQRIIDCTREDLGRRREREAARLHAAVVAGGVDAAIVVGERHGDEPWRGAADGDGGGGHVARGERDVELVLLAVDVVVEVAAGAVHDARGDGAAGRVGPGDPVEGVAAGER